MATNTTLTPTMITRECLRILHGKINFIGRVNRQYDDRYAQSGAKIGSTLGIRMPPKYTVRTNATLAAQEYYDRSTPLTVSSQYGVGDALPATVVIDRQGVVKLFRSGGAVEAAQLRRVVTSLL